MNIRALKANKERFESRENSDEIKQPSEITLLHEKSG